MGDDSQLQWWSDTVLEGAAARLLTRSALRRIRSALAQDRMPPALLVVGPPHLGRERCALEAAAMLLCSAGPDQEALCACGSCSRVRRGLHPDVTAVFPEGAAGRIPIDQVRSIVTAARGRPFEGRCRVWILDGVEATRFGAEAANAFLKTLEEPPEHVRFILLAANPEAVLPTIRSRCQKLVLPGETAAAVQTEASIRVPELSGAGGDPEWIDASVAAVTEALETAVATGDALALVRVAYRLTRECSENVEDATLALNVCSAAAIRAACAADEGGDELAALAAELLAVQRRSLALNLAPDRQLLSTLLRWLQSAATVPA